MKLRGDRNQCQGCKVYFNSTTAFDKHRVGEFGGGRRCLSEDEMLAKGMVLGASGFWVGSRMPIAGSLYMQNSGDRGSVDMEVATGVENG